MTTQTDLAHARRCANWLASALSGGGSEFNAKLLQAVATTRSMADELERLRAQVAPAAALDDKRIDDLLCDLDQIARDRDIYEYGLPIDCTATDGPHEAMRAAVRSALAAAPAHQDTTAPAGASRPAETGGSQSRAVVPSLTVGAEPDFTDWGRAAVAWVLWHHQGGSSAIGQPLRFALGLGAHESLPAHLIASAQEWAKSVGATTDEFHQQKAAQAQPVAWRWKLSEHFDDWVLTMDKDKAERARGFGYGVEPLFGTPGNPPAQGVGLALRQPACRYISDVLASDASSGEKHIARTLMHLLPLDALGKSQAGELPPLPTGAANFYPNGGNDWLPGYTAEQMHAYARAALAQAQKEQP